MSSVGTSTRHLPTSPNGPHFPIASGLAGSTPPSMPPLPQPQPQPEVRPRALQEELRELAEVVGSVPLVDLLLERAFQLNATDIHFDPQATGLRIRLRVDGMLHDVLQVRGELVLPMISRLKLMANMDITERRSVQDGHINSSQLKRQRDIRVGSGPTIHGERLVLRLMPDAAVHNRLDDLGFDRDQISVVRRCLESPSGTLLCVGPVGSGKSTTIHGCLNHLNESSRSLVTIEDPVERRIDGINQIQVDPRTDFTFVKALRGVLRQDPDVLMIGEIRDPESAHISVRAGLAGVTVLSTLHANDALSAIDVFREFSVPPMFIADSVRGIIAQRLVRKVCPHCQETYVPDEAMCDLLRIDGSLVSLVRGRGCDACFHTGYFGRTGIFEVLLMTDELRHAILRNRPHGELLEVARSRGLRLLEETARDKVLDGTTTIAEMLRVLTV
ncbi:MAG TPA: GspE/PulE family protein [Planctomycetaceae bacterium]|nr:GspE/PulE family protein [Planctomycetaceae bacterium]